MQRQQHPTNFASHIGTRSRMIIFKCWRVVCAFILKWVGKQSYELCPFSPVSFYPHPRKDNDVDDFRFVDRHDELCRVIISQMLAAFVLFCVKRNRVAIRWSLAFSNVDSFHSLLLSFLHWDSKEGSEESYKAWGPTTLSWGTWQHRRGRQNKTTDREHMGEDTRTGLRIIRYALMTLYSETSSRLCVVLWLSKGREESLRMRYCKSFQTWFCLLFH